jgi:MGT family glycosyltransferase
MAGMSRILVATVPVVGHIAPLLPLTRGLIARGHEIRWYSGRKHASRIEATGARFVSFVQAPDYDDLEFDSQFPGRSTLKGLDQLRFDLKQIFIDAAPGQLADIEAIASEWRPEVIVADPGMMGAAFAHEKCNYPLVSVSVVPFVLRSRDTAPFGLGLAPSRSLAGRLRNLLLNQFIEHVVFRDVQRHWEQTRARIGLPKGGFLFDGPRRVTRFLLPTVPGFEYPRSDMPDNVEFIGILPASGPHGAQTPPWFAELNGTRPIVHVSQGTVANTKPELIGPAIEGLAGEDVLVVVSTGGRPLEDLGLTQLPKNVRVASFLPYPELLPRTSVMVTNGGYGGVQIALSHGVPLVVAGTTEDKPEVAARVAWSGAGLNLKTSAPTAEGVRVAVRKVLAEPNFRFHAKRLASEFAQYDAVSRGVDAIEKVIAQRDLRSRRPQD